jgi:AcrR family transcriptional regulator
MPKMSDDQRNARRQHILTSAWVRFSRDGFHVTSMDQIIAETGMSSSAVYRYFRSKDELIEATFEEALSRVTQMLGLLQDEDPLPGPEAVLQTFADRLSRDDSPADYDMTRIIIAAWSEALRRPEMLKRTHSAYHDSHTALADLARRWQTAGALPAEADPENVAWVLLTLMPGMIATRHLFDMATPRQLVDGITALATEGG